MPIEKRLSLFSVEAAQVFDTACLIAQEMRHKTVEMGHVLLALNHTDNSVAQYVFTKINMSDQKIEKFINKTVQIYELSSRLKPVPSIAFGLILEKAGKESLREAEQMRQAITFIKNDIECQLSPEIRQTFELLYLRLGYLIPPIGTEHILLGSIRVAKRYDIDLLDFLGVTMGELREFIRLAHFQGPHRV